MCSYGLLHNTLVMNEIMHKGYWVQPMEKQTKQSNSLYFLKHNHAVTRNKILYA